jgi:prepilin-type processing-associated H-X9-DG protein
MVIDTAHVRGAWTSAGDPTVRGLDLEVPAYIGRGAPLGGTHGGGAQAAFADGSVRFLAESIDPPVLEALATVQGSKSAVPPGDE